MSFDSYDGGFGANRHISPLDPLIGLADDDDFFDSFKPSLQDCSPPHRITFDEAQAVANILITLPEIIAVELYGSISRDSVGNDLDLVLVTGNEALYQKFVEKTLESLPAFANKGPLARAFAVAETLGSSRFKTALGLFEIYGIDPWVQKRLDLFIMPIGWHDRTDEIQSKFPHDDSDFVRTIAGDARVIATR